MSKKNIYTSGYPVNLIALKNVDLDKWLREYRPFVRYDEFQKIFDNCFEAYISCLPERGDTKPVICDFFLIIYKIVFDLALRTFFFTRLIRLEENSVKFIIRNEKISIEAEKKRLKKSLFFSPNIFYESAIDKLRSRWRMIRLNIGEKGLIGEYLKNNIIFVIGSKNAEEIKSFLYERKKTPYILQPSLMKDKNAEIPLKSVKLIRESLANFIAKFKELSSFYAADFLKGDEILEDYIEFTEAAFVRFMQHNSYLRRKRPKGDLLVTGCTSLAHRLFFTNWRYYCGDVYTFSHGNNFFNAYKPFPFYAMHHFILSDFFVTGSKGETYQVKEAVADMNFSEEINCRIINPEKSFYKSLFEKLQKQPRPKPGKPRRIMVVGCPYGEHHYPPFFPLHYALAFLHLELRIIKSLKKAGFYVIYQAHPESLDKTYGIFDKITDEFSTDYFENSYRRADSLVFPTHATTTFGYALCSNTPIVLFYIKGCFWHKKVFQFLKKRCILVDTVYNSDQDVLDFDCNELEGAVIRSINYQPDYSIVEEFAL